MNAKGEIHDDLVLDRWTYELAAKLRRYWWLGATLAVLFSIGGYWLSYTQPVIYKATVTVIPSDQNDMQGLGRMQGLAAIAGINLQGGAENAEALATLRSQRFADMFITQAGISEAICQLYCESALVPPVDEEMLKLRSIRAFESSLRRIEEDRQAGVVRVSFLWPDRKEAAEMANRMVGQVNDALRERARTEAESNLKYLQAELDRTSRVELRQALHQLVERQAARIMEANVTTDYAFRVIDPALPADSAMPESPRRMVWGAVGAFLGILVAVGAISVTVRSSGWGRA